MFYIWRIAEITVIFITNYDLSEQLKLVLVLKPSAPIQQQQTQQLSQFKQQQPLQGRHQKQQQQQPRAR